jgi:rRNA-processing protein FCF1
MEYKYNEREYAKKIHKEGFQTRFIKYELVILVKYLKELGKTKKDTEKEVYEFCEKYINKFNKVKYFKTIDGAIRDGRKRSNKLIVLDSIMIMNSELEHIDKLDITHEYKKLLLSMLVSKKISFELSKLQPEQNGGEKKLSLFVGGSAKKFKEIFKLANITSKYEVDGKYYTYKIDDMISDLVQKDLVSSLDNNSGLIHLNCFKEIVQDGEIFYELKNKDFDNIGYIFDYYKGENRIIRCEICKSLFKSKSNKAHDKYCNSCKIDKNKEKKRTWKQKVDQAKKSESVDTTKVE